MLVFLLTGVIPFFPKETTVNRRVVSSSLTCGANSEEGTLRRPLFAQAVALTTRLLIPMRRDCEFSRSIGITCGAISNKGRSGVLFVFGAFHGPTLVPVFNLCDMGCDIA